MERSNCSLKQLFADLSKDVDDYFQKEVDLMKRLNHPHIVKLYGISTPPNENKIMVLEYLDRRKFISTITRKKNQIFVTATNAIIN